MRYRVALKFQSAANIAERTVEFVDATLIGLDVIETAVHVAYHQLPQRLIPLAAGHAEMMAYLELHAPGDVSRLQYFDDTDLRGPEWLKEFVVKAEIMEE